MQECIESLNIFFDSFANMPHFDYLCTRIKLNHHMTQEEIEERFREKASTYLVCYSTVCPRRDHCLRSILSRYVAPERRLVSSINLCNPAMQRDDCPEYRDDQLHSLPYGLKPIYHDMPRLVERGVKNRLINLWSRKRYYEYHNGTRPLTPDAEQVLRATLLSANWQHDPTFLGHVEDFLW